MPEINSPARGESSGSNSRHGWQRKIFSLSGTPSQHIGASRVGRAYVEEKEGVLAEGGNRVEPQRKTFCQSLECCCFESSLISLATGSQPTLSFASLPLPPYICFPPGPRPSPTQFLLAPFPYPIASTFSSEPPIGAKYLPFHR